MILLMTYTLNPAAMTMSTPQVIHAAQRVVGSSAFMWRMILSDKSVYRNLHVYGGERDTAACGLLYSHPRWGHQGQLHEPLSEPEPPYLLPLPTVGWCRASATGTRWRQCGTAPSRRRWCQLLGRR